MKALGFGRWWILLVLYTTFVIVAFWSVSASWSEPPQFAPGETERLLHVDERNLGMAAVTNAVSTGVTGASILLGVVGAIIGLGAHLIPQYSKPHFVMAAGFCGTSLLFAAVNMAAVPQLTWSENVAFSSFVGRFLALQIYTLVPAFFSVFVGVLQVIRGEK